MPITSPAQQARSRARRPRARAGFTLMEMMISVTILGFITAAAVSFFRVQLRTVTSTAGRFDAQQNANYAANLVEQELRVAGVGVRDQQPLIVLASSSAIAFNGDVITTIPNNPAAIYYNPDAPINSANALTTARQITLPEGSATWRYPKLNYAGSASETISYYFVADTFSDLADERMLMRRVNDQPPRLVARGIRYDASIPFFRYFRKTAAGLAEIPQASFPIWHSDSVHKVRCVGTCAPGANEPAASALTDSIAVVQVAFTGIFRDTRGDSATRTIVRRIAIKNAGLLGRPTCGNAPDAPSRLRLRSALSTEPSYPGAVFTFDRSTDEGAGARDVKTYAIYRRISPETDWGEPIAIIPASAPASGEYEYNDLLPIGTVVRYAARAQDCGLTYSNQPDTSDETIAP